MSLQAEFPLSPADALSTREATVRGASVAGARGNGFTTVLKRAARLFLSRRFATFLVFGGLAAVVNLAVGRLLYGTSGGAAGMLPYWLAVGIGSAAGLLVNFGLNYAYNFRYGGRTAGAQLRTFIVVAAGGVALTAVIAQAARGTFAALGYDRALDIAGVPVDPAFAAHVVATGLVTFYSFAAHSAFSFNAGLRSAVARALAR
ncbi:MAG: GtrA family protein [Rhodospirillales bacterium]|nr:MAG: GtrA family protein [Rhodospirillales bacterium]